MIFKRNFFKKGDNIDFINWKALLVLRHYTTRFGSIKPRKYTGNSVKHQKMVRRAIIRSRELGLTPYIK